MHSRASTFAETMEDFLANMKKEASQSSNGNNARRYPQVHAVALHACPLT
jgi:hypothetical protein